MLKVKTGLVSVMLAYSLTATLLSLAMEVAKVVAPSNDVPVPSSVRGRLSQVADVRAFAPLPNGDDVVVFDTIRDMPDNADFMDNHPHLALVHAGSPLFDLDAIDIAPSGPVRFHGLLISPQPSNPVIVVAAFTLGVNSAKTFFVFIAHNSRGYKVAATLSAAQAQLRFNDDLRGRFELWAADGQSASDVAHQCVWCPKYTR